MIVRLLLFSLTALPLWAQCDAWRLIQDDPMNYYLRDGYWDGNQFVFLGSINGPSLIYTSPTGAAPYRQILPPFQALGMSYNGLAHIGVGHAGAIAYSSDLTSWTHVDTGLTVDFYAVAGGDGFLSLAAADGLYRMQDHTTAPVKVLDMAGVYNVQQLGETLVACGDDFIATSSDGIGWQTVVANQLYQSAAWNGSTAIVGGSMGRVMVSHDFIEWTEVYIGYNATILSTVWNGTHFIMSTGTNFAISTDGENWSDLSSGAPPNTNFRSLASNGSRTLALGALGAVYLSDDTLTWTLQAAAEPGPNLIAGADMQNITLLLPEAPDNRYFYSEDGLTWLTRTSVLPESTHDNPTIDADDDLFLMGGRDGMVALSNDGQTWSSEHTGTPHPMLHVAVGADKLLAVNTPHQVFRRDRQTPGWETLGNLPTLTNDLEAGPAAFLVAGQAGGIYVSSDGAAWEQVSLPTSNVIRNITYNGGTPQDILLAVGAGVILYSNNGVDWDLVYQGEETLLDAVQAGDRFYAVGQDAILSSPDGRAWTVVPTGVGSIQLNTVNWNGTRPLAGGDVGAPITTVCDPACDPPIVETQPQSQNVDPGESTTFSMVVNGDEPLTYQWYFNDQAIVGAVSAQLTILSAATSDVGSYTCRIAGPCGSVLTIPAQLVLTDVPLITQHPIDTAACSGQDINLTVAAAGIGSLEYRWYFNAEELPGETAATLSLENVQSSDTGDYYCTVTNEAGTAISLTARLEVGVTPSIQDQPAEEINVCEGDNFTLSVTATGENLEYEWYDTWTDEIIGTDADLEFTNIDGFGRFLCRIWSGNCFTETHEIRVFVDNPPDVEVLTPGPFTPCPGVPLTLRVNSQNADYQWYQNDELLLGEVFHSYQVPFDQLDGVHIFHCVVSTEGCSVATDPIQVYVTDFIPPAVTGAPDNPVCVGLPLELTAVNGDEDALYEWRKDGEIIAGAESNTLIIPSLDISDGGSYDVSVHSVCGRLNSEAVVVWVVSGLTGTVLTPAIQPLGLGPAILTLSPPCPALQTDITWTRLSDGEILAVNQLELILDGPLSETTTYQAQISHPAEPEPIFLTGTVLVPANPIMQDPNGDGCNTIADLHHVAADWALGNNAYDGDGNGFLDIRDLLFINTSQSECPK